MKIKNILITGGSGFIGSKLTQKLVGKGYKVVILDNMSNQIHGENFQNSELFQSIKNIAKIRIGTVCNRADWVNALVDIDAVIHLAAETGTGQSMYEVEKYTSVNIIGTSLLFDILANNQHNIKKIIIASSRAIYGEGKYYCELHGNVYPFERLDEDLKIGDFNPKCPVCKANISVHATDESSLIHPTSLYGLTKQTQEDLCMLMGRVLNIPIVALRYQNVYGPGQSLKNPYTGILSIFSNRIKNGNDINIFEDGKESRDFVYIDDVVDATILSIEMEEANNYRFNVGTGIATDVLTVAETLIRKYQINTKIFISGKYRLGDIRHNFADITLIKEKLGFKPKVGFEEGIDKFVKWVNNQEIVEDKFESSIEELEKKGLFK